MAGRVAAARRSGGKEKGDWKKTGVVGVAAGTMRRRSGGRRVHEHVCSVHRAASPFDLLGYYRVPLSGGKTTGKQRDRLDDVGGGVDKAGTNGDGKGRL